MNKRDFNIRTAFNEIADLQEFEPKRLCSEDKNYKDLYGFIIGLAAFFNDITTLRQFHSYLKTLEPKPEVSKQSGAYNGIRIFLEKSIMSLIHEFFKFLNNDKNKTLFQTDLFKEKILKKIENEEKSIFRELVIIAENKRNKSLLFNKLIFIRHNVSFHYSSPELYRGYKYFFNTMKPDSKCYYSIGNSDFQTRYYFADAAVQGYIEEKTGYTEDQSFYDELTDELNKINRIIYKIIKVFLTPKRNI